MSTATRTIPLEVMEKSAGDTIAMTGTAFERLPEEIVEQILQLATPNSFASLVVLNRKWRVISQQAHHYIHQLSQCPSYSAAHAAILLPRDDESLPQLRRLFAHEVKRNLFEVYLRPRETVIKLVSTSISSSSAPGGEAFHFTLSPRGHYVLAYSSSRIHIIDVTSPDVKVKRELKILRRPASASIADDGSTLAVLSTDLQVDLYDLTGELPKHTRAINLDHTPRTICLSPTGSVLAIAFDSGVEVSSVNDSISTDRRAVKCYAVDSLSFSRDGTQLLGTTSKSRNPSTVVLTAPYHNPTGNLAEDSVSALWTTSILFPNGSRDCSHAVLLPGATDGEAIWTFTYDRVFETFRAVRIDDLRNGTTYFTGPTADCSAVSKLLPSTLPTASESGDLVAAGFKGSIWLYGIPEDLDAPPYVVVGTGSGMGSGSSTPSIQIGRRNSAPSLRSVNQTRESTSRTPQWQLLSDRFRNNFIEGRKIASLDGVTAMNWVNAASTPFHGERLVAVAPGVGDQHHLGDDDGMSPVDGGRISILDFSYGITDGDKSYVTIEVGLNDPEVLEEEFRDLDTEVAIVRRRTVAQRRGHRSNVVVTATAPPANPEPQGMSLVLDPSDPFGLPLSARRANQPVASTEQSETASVDEQEALDAPYSHSSPRSVTTLRRAATAAAVSRRLHPVGISQGQIEYRRADGREEHPDESDADNWVPPPPPYSRDALPPLPEHIQRSILSEASLSLQRASTEPAPHIGISGLDSGGLHRSLTFDSAGTSESQSYNIPVHRASTSIATDATSIDNDSARPSTRPVASDFDDLYDVSPPGSPGIPPHRSPTNKIPRRPVGSNADSRSSIPSSPDPVMSATLQQPLSPIPQPMNENLDRRSSDGGSTTGPVDLASHLRLNDDHRSSLPPLPTAVGQNHLRRVPVPKRLSLPTSSSNSRHLQTGAGQQSGDTAPPLSQSSEAPSSPGLFMPSADQLARLNSRTGRPTRNVLSDPSRRSSRSLSYNGVDSGVTEHPARTPFRNAQQQILPGQDVVSTAPTAAAGAYRSQSNTGYAGSHNSRPSSSVRRPSVGGSRSNRRSISPPTLRPVMHRLDTIHSVGSSAEPSPYIIHKAMTLGRHPSRAERSAAKNIKDAKRRGWRASLRKEKDSVRDAASSAGWTDVSHESGKRSIDKKTDGKCVAM